MDTQKKNSNRLFYIDNLRIFLISLVVLHHLSITYGAPGSWYYNEIQAGIPEITGKQWFIFAQLLISIGFPLLFILGNAANKGIDPFSGGSTVQSLSYAVWEQLTGFSLIIGLLGISKKYNNQQGNFAKQLSASAYGVFVVHTPAIVAISCY